MNGNRNASARIWLWVFLLTLAGHASAETIRVSGVGLSAPLMQRLAEAYRKQQPGDQVAVLMPPLGSDGALRAVAAGELDLAVAGREPKPEEAEKTGKVWPLARTAFGFATTSGVRRSGLTIRDVADIYAGKLQRWDDEQPIRLIMRAERETDTKLVRGLSAETHEAMDVAFKRKGLVVAENDLDTLRLLETVPGAFGPTTSGLAKTQGSPVNFLPINGVVPSVQALAEGRYPYSKALFVVLPKTTSKATDRFMFFLKSKQAVELMRSLEFLPSGP